MSQAPASNRVLTVSLIVIALVVGLGLGGGAVVLFGPSGGAGGAGPGGGGAAQAQQGPPPASVILDEARRMALQERFSVTGRLRAIRRVTIASQVEGVLLELPVDAGDAVVGDQTVLARVEDVFVRIERQAAAADVAAARAELDQSQRDLTYLESLAESNAARPKEVEDARSLVATNQARLEAAQARLRRAEENLQRVVVTAPFDGTITAKHAEVGQRVEVGHALVELVSRGAIEAIMDVPERIVNQITPGDEVEMIIDALDERVTGKVVGINPDGTGAARTYPVRVQLDDRGGTLKPGMSVTAKMPLEAMTPRMTVPRDAIQPGATGNRVVWVAVPSEAGPPTGQAVPVEVLFGHADRFAVMPEPGPMAGILTDKAQVVVQGAERIVMPGQPLEVLESSEDMPALENTGNDNDNDNDHNDNDAAARRADPPATPENDG